METNIQENLQRIFNHLLEERKMPLSLVAKKCGYTTTTQLHNTISGDSMISTKAVINMVHNLNINPVYLFTGKGTIYLTEESELESLEKKHEDALREVMELKNKLFECKKEQAIAVGRYNNLIDITSAAMKNTQKADQKEGEITPKEESK